MKLSSVYTQNYKNLHFDDADGIQIGNLSVYIGPNGSGKSNLISILQWLKQSISTVAPEVGVSAFEKAIFDLGAGRMLDKQIPYPAKVTFILLFHSDQGQKLRLCIELDIRASHSPPYISFESLQTLALQNTDSPFKHYEFHNRQPGIGVVSVYKNEQKTSSFFQKVENVSTKDLGLHKVPEILENSTSAPENTPVYKIRRELLDFIEGWRFYNANHMNLRAIRNAEPKIGQSDVYLSASGENLATVLHNLTTESLDFEEKINLALRTILPPTRKVRATGRLSLAVEWHFQDSQEPLFLDEISDGTVRMLCWATILLSPKLPTLLVLDEPEMGIHVAWLPFLAEWIKAAAEKTQVIISTHSPDLLDHFSDQTSNVWVFKSDNNPMTTTPKRLSSEALTPWEAEGWKLGDLYRVGDPSVGGWPW